MPLDIVALLPSLLYAALLLIAAAYDFFKRRIPNWTVAGLLLVFVPAAWFGLTPAFWASSLAAFAIALVCSGALYLLGWIGAGDSKLFSAAALYTGLSNLLLLSLATALAGGLYALAVIFIRPRSVLRGMTARGRAESKGKLRGIPYGVAIAVGALVTAYLTNFLDFQTKPQSMQVGPTQAAAAER